MNIEKIAIKIDGRLSASGLVATSVAYAIAFAHALLAELSKDAEPALVRYNAFVEALDEPNPIERLRFFLSLALTGQDWLDVEQFINDLPAPVIASEQKPIAWMFSKGPITKLDTWPHGGNWIPLFTSPPNTADIEQRVAEACAKLVDFGYTDPVGAIRESKWREFM